MGLRRVDMHSLRHSFASALIMAGAPVTEVQHLLGHSSPQTTLKVYSHWFANTQSDSVDRLSRTLAGNLGHFLDTLGHSRGPVQIGERAQIFDFTEESMAPPAGFEPTAPGLGISAARTAKPFILIRFARGQRPTVPEIVPVRLIAPASKRCVRAGPRWNLPTFELLSQAQDPLSTAACAP
jgi:hypothetical protein